MLDQFSLITRPFTRSNGLKTIPFTRPNGLKTIPSPAAHIRISNIWDYPPPPPPPGPPLINKADNCSQLKSNSCYGTYQATFFSSIKDCAFGICFKVLQNPTPLSPSIAKWPALNALMWIFVKSCNEWTINH